MKNNNYTARCSLIDSILFSEMNNSSLHGFSFHFAELFFKLLIKNFERNRMKPVAIHLKMNFFLWYVQRFNLIIEMVEIVIRRQCETINKISLYSRKSWVHVQGLILNKFTSECNYHHSERKKKKWCHSIETVKYCAICGKSMNYHLKDELQTFIFGSVTTGFCVFVK